MYMNDWFSIRLVLVSNILSMMKKYIPDSLELYCCLTFDVVCEEESGFLHLGCSSGLLVSRFLSTFSSPSSLSYYNFKIQLI